MLVADQALVRHGCRSRIRTPPWMVAAVLTYRELTAARLLGAGRSAADTSITGRCGALRRVLPAG